MVNFKCSLWSSISIVIGVMVWRINLCMNASVVGLVGVGVLLLEVNGCESYFL